MPLKLAYSGYLTCPLCDAEVPLDGDEKSGDQVCCPYCESPLKLKRTRADEAFLVEDF
ncbi:MAG: hypothetical protein ACE5EI_00875 [Thermodesulfobacteriota bacterium]